MSPLDFRILGPFEVAAGDRPGELMARQQRALLAWLVVELNQVVSIDGLIEGLWGAAVPASAGTTLKSLVSRVRRVLADDPEVRLVASPPGYILEADPSQVDARRFEALVGRARRILGDDPQAAAASLHEALDLWRGPVLADLAEYHFAVAEGVRLEEIRLAAVEDLAEAQLAVGRYPEVVALLEPHVARNPFRERAWGQLMVALYQSGRQAESLRAYQKLRRALGEELGIEPSPALRRLEEQILLQRLGPAASIPDSGGETGEGGEARTNLPVLLNRFVGRDTERRRVAELLRSSRLVTLTGPGGVGKTRLAIEAAHPLAPSFPGGVFLVDLAPVAEAELVAPQMAAAVELPAGEHQASRTALVDQLVERLRRRAVLLLLDNCEHLVGTVAALVDTLLQRCPALVVLATSRERLGVAGEMVWRVPSLSVPDAEMSTPDDVAATDAVELFCARARSLDADFVLGADNAASVARICRRLDGIPLAVELAAARLSVLGPGEIADRLDERFRLLSVASTGAPNRHQTLRNCMDWGYGLLGEPERTALRRLSVFAASFDIEAAESVVPDAVPGAEVLDLVARLVDTSWVAIESGRDGTRFRLTESVRQYVAERLEEAGEDNWIGDRHRDYFLLAASGYLGPPLCAPRRWLSRVSSNYENLRSALDWSWRRGDTESVLRLAGHLFPYWALDGRFLEGRLWLERALESDTGPSRPARTWALVALGLLVAQLGDSDEASALWSRAREDATTTGDSLSAAYAAGYLGGLAFSRADPATAENFLSRARDGCAAAQAFLGVAWCDFNLAFARLARSDPEGATAAFERALVAGKDHGSDVLVTHASSALASVVALDGDHQRAVALADASVAAARRLRLRHVLVMSLARGAETAVLAGERARAAALLREALHTVRELGGRMWVPDLLQLAAIVLDGDGHAQAAVRLLSAGAGKAAGGGLGGGGHRPLAVLVEKSRARLAEILDCDVFDRQWRDGSALSAHEAVDEALLDLAGGLRQHRTFMFTDIVQSTKLVEALGDEAWSHLLRWHDETLRSLYLTHGGEEIKHTGDGFFVAFQQPGRAVDCAIAVQRALARHRQEHGFAPGVRIGLHEVDATRIGDDYEGKGIHEAARIAALAETHEILASLASVDGVPGRCWSLPRAVRLKGLSQPVEVVTVDWG